MNKKVIPTIEENVIKKAEACFRKNNNGLSPIVKQLKGSFKVPENFDYKKELAERFAKIYYRK